MEQFANNATTTLASACGSGDATVIVSDASRFPSSGNFRIRIDSELMLVTGVSGTTFTVTRGVESTSAVAHVLSATVSHVGTAGALRQFQQDIAGVGTFANRPAQGTAGRLWAASDANVLSADTGTIWQTFGPVYPLTDPTTSSFSWTNQGTSTVSTSSGGIYLTAPPVVSDSLSVYDTALTSNADGHSVTMCLAVNGGGVSTTNWNAGIALSARGTGNALATFMVAGGNSFVSEFAYLAWTNTTTFGSTRSSKSYSNAGFLLAGNYFWLRRLVSSTNQLWQVSGDGVTFATVLSIGKSDSVAASPTTIGLYADNLTSTTDNVGVHLLSLTQA